MHFLDLFKNKSKKKYIDILYTMTEKNLKCSKKDCHNEHPFKCPTCDNITCHECYYEFIEKSKYFDFHRMLCRDQSSKHILMICRECFEKKYMIEPLKMHNDCALCPNLDNKETHNYHLGAIMMKTCGDCSDRIAKNAKEILKKTVSDNMTIYGKNKQMEYLFDLLNNGTKYLR